jgi:hypothetical protein
MLIKFEAFSSIHKVSKAVEENGADEVTKMYNFIKPNLGILNTRLIKDTSVIYVNKLIDKILGNDYDLSHSELRVLYEIYDILEKDLKNFSEIDDYFLDWLDTKKWGISKAVAPGCYIFHIHGDYKDYSNFFADIDSISKRRSIDIVITSISCNQFLAVSIKVNKK